MTHLAREFGLSDVALHKICRKYRVPTPPPGYWAKKAFGKAVKVVPLADQADTSEIVIREGSASNEPEVMIDARAGVIAVLEGSDTKSEGISHPVVERTLAKLSGAKPRADGLLHADGGGLIKVAVRPESVARLREVLPLLAGCAAKAGIELARGQLSAVWSCAGQTIVFEVIEAADKIEHVATEKELAAVAKWKREREERHRRYGYWDDWGEPKIPKWEYRHQGRLMVRLENVRLKSEASPRGEPIRHSFAETRSRRIEKAIPGILSTVAAIAEAKASNSKFEEREHEAAAERARKWAEAERARIAEARAVQMLDQLVEEREKIARLRALLDPLVLEELGGRGSQWLEWAQARLNVMERQLSPQILEERLAASGLFESGA